MSAQTARLAITPAPAGKPGGPGLYHVKGLGHADYFQQIRNALIRSGHTEAEASQMTWGILRRWARGGGKVRPEVRAAAAAALAHEKAAQAIAHAQSNEDGDAVDLSSDLGEAMAASWLELAGPAPAVATGAQVNIATGATGPRAKPAGGGKQSGSGGGSSGSLHPHVAAGSPAGGQFAKKGSGSSSSGSSGKASTAKKTAAKGATAKAPAGKSTASKAAPPKTAAKAPAKTPAKAKQPGKAAPPKMTGKPLPKAGSRQQAIQQRTGLLKQAAGDRAKAKAINARIASLTTAIHAAVKAAAAQKAAAANKKSATATAATAVKAAATAPAASTTTAAGATKTTTASTTAAKATATVAQMRATRKTLRARVVTLKAHAAGLEKQAAAIKLSGDAAAIDLAGPKGYEHGWIKVGVSEHDAPEEKAGKMSANAFRRGDGTQDALQGHREAAKAHRAAAQASSSPARSAYHAKMATLHSRVASTRMTSSKAEDQAHGLHPSIGSFANSGAGRFLEMAFAEALTERVPPGKTEGGQFHARTSLTRHDTPEEAARAVNAMSEAQRAAVRASTLPPPGFEWARGDRLALAY